MTPSAAGPYTAYSVSWNLTQRCNLFCAHCYISGAPSASAAGELSTDECRRVMADMARVNPGTFLILTGGEPLLRHDIFELAAEGREHGFTVVLGTNGAAPGASAPSIVARRPPIARPVVSFLSNVLHRLPHAQGTEPIPVRRHVAPHLVRFNPCVLAQRPADRLSNEEIVPQARIGHTARRSASSS